MSLKQKQRERMQKLWLKQPPKAGAPPRHYPKMQAGGKFTSDYLAQLKAQQDRLEQLRKETNIRLRSVGDAAAIFQDDRQAAKYLLATGAVKEERIPVGGYSPLRISEAYALKSPKGKWGLKIKRDMRRKEVDMHLVGPAEALSSPEAVRTEVYKILRLLDLIAIGEVRDIRRPKAERGLVEVKIIVPVDAIGQRVKRGRKE